MTMVNKIIMPFVCDKLFIIANGKIVLNFFFFFFLRGNCSLTLNYQELSFKSAYLCL